MDGDLLLGLIRKRRSVRRYAARPIETEKMRRILEAGRLAPSSCNKQPWHFVAVTDARMIWALSRCAPVGSRVNKWMETAPLVVVICANPHPVIHKAAQWIERDCHKIDIGIAGQQMDLMAAAMGLGSCWIGWFSENKVKKLLNVPEAMEVAAMLVIGYPEADPDSGEPSPPEKRRKRFDEIVSFNHFGEKNK